MVRCLANLPVTSFDYCRRESNSTRSPGIVSVRAPPEAGLLAVGDCLCGQIKAGWAYRCDVGETDAGGRQA